jgi:hypothetical protein
MQQLKSIGQSVKAPAPPVILVNETVARTWWPDGGALVSHVAVGRFHRTDYIIEP